MSVSVLHTSRIALAARGPEEATTLSRNWARAITQPIGDRHIGYPCEDVDRVPTVCTLPWQDETSTYNINRWIVH